MACPPAALAEDRRTSARRALTLLFRFAIDADARPRYRLQAGRRDLVFAFHADAVCAVIHAMNGFFNRAKELGIGLLEREADVKVAFLAGLIDPIAALGAWLGCRGSNWSRSHQFVPFFLQEFSVLLYIYRMHTATLEQLR